jgi:glycerophosphoryl diester phosphodiesterase
MYNSAMRSLPVAPPPPSLRSLASPWARTLLTGHRGASAYEPGNTLASFERAIAMGADVLECDVRETRDGTLVLAHDGIIGHGRAVTRIRRATATQLRGHHGADGVLTLAEFLSFVAAHDGLLLNIDLKAAKIEGALVAMLTAHDLIARTIVTSRASHQLRRLRVLTPALRLGLSKSSNPPHGPHGLPERTAIHTQRILMPRTLPDVLRRARADAAYLQYRVITPHLVDALHRAHLGCYAWTVDDPHIAARLLHWGVDGITTNRPDIMRPLVTHANEHIRKGVRHAGDYPG